MRFRTVEVMIPANYKSLPGSIYTTINVYQSREFEVVQIRRDHKFECLCESLRPIHLHIAATGEHVPEVDRFEAMLEPFSTH